MPEKANSNKRDAINPTNFQILWANRIKQEEKSAEQWALKWGFGEDPKKNEKLLNSTVQSKVHNYLLESNTKHDIIKNIDTGIAFETIDKTTSKRLSPNYYHLIGETIKTKGVDPNLKYPAPLTTSQQIGWFAKNSYDFTLERRPKTDITKGVYTIKRNPKASRTNNK